ncbi:pilus assembly protein TadG-related protein [Streptomyces longisporoflavus]|uniref:Pilus assembly protein TadG-related protein n=1 Tax=Streptomyces longisporoflavus TaxID=28044 RepID=A0ABW7R4Z2_9ACTN
MSIKEHSRARRRGRGEGERGSVTLYFLGFAIVMIGLLALLVDGGRLLMASANAEDIAAEAARSAGQEINGPDAITGDGTRADPQKAAATAQAFLADAGVQGTVTISEDGQSITITVHDTYQTLLLGGFGYSSMQVTAHADVTLERTDPGA